MTEDKSQNPEKFLHNSEAPGLFRKDNKRHMTVTTEPKYTLK
jgi:hypothetical protein